LSVHDLSRHIGSEISGVDLREPLDQGIAGLLRAACAERIVLLFRRQHGLTASGLVAFARCFGGSCAEAGPARDECPPGPHWDGGDATAPFPVMFTLRHALQTPPCGGETSYANAMAAHDAMPAALRERIAALPAARQPLRRHPDLGRLALHPPADLPSPRRAAEARDLRAAVLAHITGRAFVHSHHWLPGDVLIADERCSLHRTGAWDAERYTRVVRRITLSAAAATH
jgi:taurine dioxygenase